MTARDDVIDAATWLLSRLSTEDAATVRDLIDMAASAPVVEISQPIRQAEPWYGTSKRVPPMEAPQELKITLPDYVVTATLMPGTLIYRTKAAAS